MTVLASVSRCSTSPKCFFFFSFRQLLCLHPWVYDNDCCEAYSKTSQLGYMQSGSVRLSLNLWIKKNALPFFSLSCNVPAAKQRHTFFIGSSLDLWQWCYGTPDRSMQGLFLCRTNTLWCSDEQWAISLSKIWNVTTDLYGGALKDEQRTQDVNTHLRKIGFHWSVVVCNFRRRDVVVKRCWTARRGGIVMLLKKRSS